MKVFNRIIEIKSYLQEQRNKGKTIGFVPTMGYLHKGHQSLIENSAAENDITVVSIFVNPAQFGPGEDYDRYPRNLQGDILLVEAAGGQIIFSPEVSELYPNGFSTYVEIKKLTDNLCGKSRPGHFLGVTTIVTKLFNIVKPDRAYFGQKDAQQAIVIQKMAADLNMDVNIVVCPIIREDDGLAMSSRNTYLNEQEREQATVLFQALTKAKELIDNGERNTVIIKTVIEKMIKDKPLATIDYISIVNLDKLEDIAQIKGKVLIALAIKFGATRLIDNIIAEV